MGFHHVALATRDTAATHAFYTEVMGFELVKVVAAPTPTGGWSKHFFYSTGESPNGENGMMAFWELHDDTIAEGFPVDLNKAAGLPWWVNHIAFDAPTMADLERHRERWRAHGQTVLQVDHEFCVSIYIRDPSGNMVEFCHSVRDFTDDERARAVDLVTNASPDLDHGDYPATVYQPLQPAT
jgi:catechol 2,3-dioxygenase-like lactoylglutathione lyase family enzyme